MKFLTKFYFFTFAPFDLLFNLLVYITHQLCVTGSNLTGACKLVFKVARNERNDNLFAAIDVPGDNLIDKFS